MQDGIEFKSLVTLCLPVKQEVDNKIGGVMERGARRGDRETGAGSEAREGGDMDRREGSICAAVVFLCRCVWILPWHPGTL